MKIIIIIIMFLISFNANANTGPFSPTDGDLSVEMLSKIFGGLIGNGADPLKDLITTFNGAVLIVGGILVAYTIFAGTIGTAHEGQVLGKKFSSVWIPLRTSVGAALVIPIDGYCAMQMIVMWIVMQGIGLADTVWISLNSGNALMSSTIKSQTINNAVISDLAYSIAKISVCLHANNKDNSIFNENQWNFYEEKNSIKAGDKNSMIRKSSCGQVYLNEIKDSEYKDILITHNDEIKKMISKLYSSTSNLVNIEKKQISGMFGTIESGSISSNFNNFDKAIIENAKKDYENAINISVQKYYDSLEEPKKSMKNSSENEGWIMAGSFFMKNAQQMSNAMSAVNSVPRVEANNKLLGMKKEVNQILDNFDIAINDNKPLNTANTADKSGEDGFMTGFYLWLGKLITSIDISDLDKQNNVHPIIQMKQIGDRLINASIASTITIISVWSGATTIAGIAAAAAGGGVSGASNTASSIAISSALFILPIVFAIFSGLLSLGFFMSYYIPMLPFLIWLGCVIGWFILVCEAIIAAPLWAVMHLHPNGDDMTGKAAQGYMLVLGLLLRPTLMIFGFSCALVLSGVLGQFINSIFFETYKASLGSNSLGFFAIMLSYVIYITAMLTFVKKMFEIIHIIPDQMLRWIGGGKEQLGQYAGALTQGTEGQFMKAGALSGAIGHQGVEKSLSSMKNANDKKHQAQEDMKNRASEQASSLNMNYSDVEKLASKNNSSNNSGNSKSNENDTYGFSAMKKIANARNQIESDGGNAQDLARFNNSISNSDKSLDESIKDALSDFKQKSSNNNSKENNSIADKENSSLSKNKNSDKSLSNDDNSSKNFNDTNKEKSASENLEKKDLTSNDFSSNISSLKKFDNKEEDKFKDDLND